MRRSMYYFKTFLVIVSAVNGCVLISAFVSLVDVPVGIASSSVGIKNCAITVRIKKYISQLSRSLKSIKNSVVSTKQVKCYQRLDF